MATQYKNLSDYNPDYMPDRETVAGQSYAIVVAEWNPEITHALLKGAVRTLIANGVLNENIHVISAPGAFELTYTASQLMRQNKKYAAIIAIGCVIKGDTPHFHYICSGVTQGITELNLRQDACPVVFGILTTNTLQQAEDRSGGIHGNKGDEAAITAIKMANIIC